MRAFSVQKSGTNKNGGKKPGFFKKGKEKRVLQEMSPKKLVGFNQEELLMKKASQSKKFNAKKLQFKSFLEVFKKNFRNGKFLNGGASWEPGLENKRKLKLGRRGGRRPEKVSNKRKPSF